MARLVRKRAQADSAATKAQAVKLHEPRSAGENCPPNRRALFNP
jgi:hypothetical protein